MFERTLVVLFTITIKKQLVKGEGVTLHRSEPLWGADRATSMTSCWMENPPNKDVNFRLSLVTTRGEVASLDLTTSVSPTGGTYLV